VVIRDGDRQIPLDEFRSAATRPALAGTCGATLGATEESGCTHPRYEAAGHCERSEATRRREARLDCFVAEFIIGPAEGRTR